MDDMEVISLDNFDFTVSAPDRGESPGAANRRSRTPYQKLAAAVLHSAAELVSRPTKQDLDEGLHAQAMTFVRDSGAVSFWFKIKNTRLEELTC